jgi:hypothetical protein
MTTRNMKLAHATSTATASGTGRYEVPPVGRGLPAGRPPGSSGDGTPPVEPPDSGEPARRPTLPGITPPPARA